MGGPILQKTTYVVSQCSSFYAKKGFPKNRSPLLAHSVPLDEIIVEFMVFIQRNNFTSIIDCFIEGVEHCQIIVSCISDGIF